jgi:hypothetical protein
MNERLRIVVGAGDFSGVAGVLAASFRRLGHAVTLALCAEDPHHANEAKFLYLGEDVWDVSWSRLSDYLRRGGPTPMRLSRRLTPPERLAWLLSRHDVFVFYHFSFWHDAAEIRRWGCGREFHLLQALGKRVIAVHSGPDVRHHLAIDQHNRHLGNNARPLAASNPRWATMPLSYYLRNLRRAELHADLIFSQPNQAPLAIRPYDHLFIPLDTSAYRARIPGREVPVVLHAPSNRGTKGTEEIHAAIERLRSRGVRCEFRIVEGAPHDRLRRELEDADVVIDQLHLPLHGKLGVEAMASGCALATCDRTDLEPWPPRRPIWHVEPSVLDERLERLLTDRPLRLRLASAARRYVDRYHRADDVTARMIGRLAGGRPQRMHVPEFFARTFRLPRDERLSQPILDLTSRVVRKWGLPAGVDAKELVRRGLMGDVRRDYEKPTRR